MVDNVNSPKHYLQGKRETIEVIQDYMTRDEFVGYLKGNLSETVEYCKQQFKKKGVYNPYLTDKKLIKKIYLSWTREVVI